MVQEPRRLHQLPPFDPETVKIVRASCAQLPSDQTELAREFYAHLFEMVPQARAMFPEDMSEQNERLLSAILGTVRHLDHPELIEAHLRRWGAEHRQSHQVSNDLYIYVAHALVRALARILGYLETSVASAWMAVYEWMAAVMIDGADASEAQEIGQQLPDPAAGRPFSALYEGAGRRSSPDAGDLSGTAGHSGPTSPTGPATTSSRRRVSVRDEAETAVEHADVAMTPFR